MRKLAALLTLALLFACKREEMAKPVTAAAVSDTALQRTAAPAAAAMPRMIIRTANVKILVDDTAKAVDAVTRAVEGVGGYVSGSHIWRDGELLRATLTLRMPSDKLTSTLAAIRGLAKRVENETISSEDASQEYVDLESQLRNLEATEIELRELMTTIRKNAKKAQEVLEMHQQLNAIRSQIEQIKGRMRYLSQVAAMSTVTLEVAPDLIQQPVVEPGWQPVVIVKDASRALVGVLQSIATTAIWFVIYVLPILGMLLLALFFGWKLIRRQRAVAS
ncbi:MAG TPA: DUF4349 domain-containing protein [Thermoanaerobaculia bacterium]|nr:DUF4349 domain-containing protein [Thermoanaerobaculia bacterium]